MNRGARKAGLSRRHRFAGRGAFAPALRSPKKIRGASMQLHVLFREGDVSRLGVSLPKRLVPRSTDRNRLKRIARETFRLHPARDRGLDLVLTPRNKYDRDRVTAWRDELVSLLDATVAGT